MSTFSNKEDNLEDNDLGSYNFEAALHWLGRGYNVLPQKSVFLKHPAVLWKGYQLERVSRQDLQRWSLKFMGGVGFVTGAISKAIVIETDGPAGETLLKEFEQSHGLIAATLMIRSGSGRGLHRHFAHPGGRVTTRANPSIQIDVKGDGGYCVLPPSRHRSGMRYEIVHDVPLTQVPAGLLAFIQYKAALAAGLNEHGSRLPGASGCRPEPTLTNTSAKYPKPPINRNNVALVLAMLDALPSSYADQYPMWIRVGFALYDFAPNEVGLALWRRFSSRCPRKSEASDFEALWETFARPYAGEKISVGWLWSQASTSGWRANCSWDRSTVTIKDED